MSFFSRGVLWMNTALPLRFGPVDARAIFFIGIWLFHWAWSTFIVGVLGIIFLFWLERIGYSIPNIGRAALAWLAGPIRPVRSGRRFDRTDR